MKRNPKSRLALMLLLTGLTSGCDSTDERLVQVSREAANRQAEQNQQIARQNLETAQTARQLVEADAHARRELIEADAAARKQLLESQAAARQEMIAMQRDVQTQQATVGNARDKLESERREMAQQRYWDSLAGQSIGAAALLIASLLPLVLCWYLLHGLRQGNGSEEDLSELLTLELVVPSPALLPQLAGPSSEVQQACLPAPAAEATGDLDDAHGDAA